MKSRFLSFLAIVALLAVPTGGAPLPVGAGNTAPPTTLAEATERQTAARTTLAAQADESQAALLKWYDAALEAMKKNAIAKGDLDSVVAIDQEHTRLDRVLTPEEKEKLPATLRGVRDQFDQGRAQREALKQTNLGASLRAYAATLETLEKNLTQKADIDGALAARKERSAAAEELKALATAAPAAPPAEVATTPPASTPPPRVPSPAAPALPFVGTLGSGSTPLIKVAAEMAANGLLNDPAKIAIPFNPPILDRATYRPGGLLLENEAGAGSKGSTWTLTLHTRGNTAVQFVHPYGNGHIVVQLTPKGVMPCRTKTWTDQPWSSGGDAAFFKRAEGVKVFPLEFKNYAVVSQLGPAGNYTLKIDGKAVATGSFAAPADFATYGSATPLLLSAAFTGEKLPMRWKPGSSAILVSGTTPGSGAAVDCANITFQARGQ